MRACYARDMTNQELIDKAAAIINRHKSGDRLIGDVGAALISEAGNLYAGVSVDTASWGLCAERSAVAAMITTGEYKVKTVTAVWYDTRDDKLYVLPPCGLCREFMRQVDPQNLETDIVLGPDNTTKLKDLLPYNEWPKPLDYVPPDSSSS